MNTRGYTADKKVFLLITEIVVRNCFVKRRPEIFFKIQQKTHVLESLCNKYPGLRPAASGKKRLQCRGFVHFSIFSRTPFFIEQC